MNMRSVSQFHDRAFTKATFNLGQRLLNRFFSVT